MPGPCAVVAYVVQSKLSNHDVELYILKAVLVAGVEAANFIEHFTSHHQESARRSYDFIWRKHFVWLLPVKMANSFELVVLYMHKDACMLYCLVWIEKLYSNSANCRVLHPFQAFRDAVFN